MGVISGGASTIGWIITIIKIIIVLIIIFYLWKAYKWVRDNVGFHGGVKGVSRRLVDRINRSITSSLSGLVPSFNFPSINIPRIR
jgi:hypothetical protein